MKRLSFGICVFILTLGATAYAGKPPACDVPISWSFMSTTAAPAAILNDDPTKAYVNGVDGVTNSVIQCETHDATLGFTANSNRRIWMKLPSAIPGSIIDGGPASFAGGNSFLTKTTFNIRNIIGYSVITLGQAATYYTRASSRFTGPDGKAYQWVSLPDDNTCPAGATCVPNFHIITLPSNINLPEQAAWTKVTYMPRDPSQPWSTTNTDSWLVQGEFIDAFNVVERATLLFIGPHSQTHYGQYSLPFKVLITALAPIPY
jgi:hypothetical protein